MNNIIKNCLNCNIEFSGSFCKIYCSTTCGSLYHYWKKSNNGLCTFCGKNSAIERLKCCELCREMRKKYKTTEPRPLENQIFNSATARAKKKKIPINITIDDIIVPDLCPVLGIKLERAVGKAKPNSPSLDRMIPELGYVKGNIMVISHKANTIKNNSTIEEVESVLKYMQNHKT